jgi:long-chain acyl-CoA synthetase
VPTRAFEKNYPAGVRWDTPIVGRTLHGLLENGIAEFGSRTAIEFRNKPISFTDLGKLVDTAAAAFLRAGYGRDSSVALYIGNTPDHPINFFGALKAGARIVHLSPLDGEIALSHKLKDSGARVLVTTNLAMMLPMALKFLDKGLIDRLIVCDDAAWGAVGNPLMPLPERKEIVRFDRFVAGATPPSRWRDIAADDIALLQYTGGTTGLPKGAMLTHGNLTSAVDIFDVWGAPSRLKRGDVIERVICVLPLFHIFALTTVLLLNLKHGNVISLHQRFDVDAVMQDIEVKRATGFPGVPTMWIAIAALPDLEKRDLSSLVYVGSGGAPLPVQVARILASRTGLSLRSGWGMTETCSPGTANPSEGPDKPGSIGLPLPSIELDIVALDDPNRVLPTGEVGEIRIKGPNVTKGYWNKPDETARAFAGDKFLTGDIGYVDDDGYFFIVDRKKDMIISGGFNVYPQMIEQAIYEHPAVQEVIVIGIPDEYRGEAGKAFVKLRSGAAQFSLEELRTFLSGKIGKHELPVALEFRDDLPKTTVGKLSRHELRVQQEKQTQAARV